MVKSIKLLTLGILFLMALAVPALFFGTASAQTSGVYCYESEEAEQLDRVSVCDVSLSKEVSVDGAAFVPADSSGDAAQATVGQSVTWRITLTNESSTGTLPTGLVTVFDALPSGFAFSSSSATTGSYVGDTWTFRFAEESDGYISNFPIVLTINTTATTAGLFENLGTLASYAAPCECFDPALGEYEDDATGNNENSAWVQVSGAPVVLGESTTATPPPQVLGLADTGNPLVQSVIAGLLIATTLAVIFIGRTKADQ